MTYGVVMVSNWTAETLGQFIANLVDSGQDDIVLQKVIDEKEPDENGNFIRKSVIIVVPNGQAVHFLAKMERAADSGVVIHKTLMAMIEKGVVK